MHADRRENDAHRAIISHRRDVVDAKHVGKTNGRADAGHYVQKNRRGRLTPFRFGEPEAGETVKTLRRRAFPLDVPCTSPTRLPATLDFDATSPFPHGERRLALRRRPVDDMAVIERELRPVPGAHDRSLLQSSFRQRAAKMCA